MRACLFCGATPQTREHVFPEWLAECVGLKKSYLRDRERGITREIRNSYDLKVKMFCGPHCNYGWMSTLEARVKPFLCPFAKGKRATLEPDQQEILASWLWKTTLTADPTGPTPCFTADDYRRFYETRRPPPDTEMFIGGFMATPNPATRRVETGNLEMVHSLLKLDGVQIAQHTVMTMTAGAVMLQARSMRLGRRMSDATVSTVGHDVCVRFWPRSDVSVRPPKAALRPEDLKEFARRWTPRLRQR